MSVKLRITVTKEVLEQTKCCMSGEAATTNCAVAIAIRDLFPQAKIFAFGMMFFQNKKSSYDVRFPEYVTDYIREFDDNTSFKRTQMPEMSFEIDIPDWVIEQINIDEIKPLLENHPTLAFLD